MLTNDHKVVRSELMCLTNSELKIKLLLYLYKINENKFRWLKEMCFVIPHHFVNITLIFK